MRPRYVAMATSGALILISIVSLVLQGLNFGIDFTGGVLLEVNYPSAVQLQDVRRTLANAGYVDAQVQSFGTASDVLIRLPPVGKNEDGEELANKVMKDLRAKVPGVELRRNDFVGPQVGQNLAEDGGLAVLFTLIMVFGYVMLRFRWKFAAGAIAALIHDVTITVGFFSVFQFTFDLTVLAAVLAVIGYSLNDTIVIYDRIRENFRTMRRGSAIEIIDTSINQTLSRTIVTALTTLLTLIALFFLGGDSVSGFALALIVGIVIGTYSSVYIASAAALELDVSPTDLQPAKRPAELDALP